MINYNTVSPGYMDMVGVGLIAGRQLRDSDTGATPDVVILNATAAEQLWPGADAVGRNVIIRDRSGTERVAAVVGVAGNTVYRRLGEQPMPFMYLPQSQWYRPDMVLHARSRSSTRDVVAALVEEARAADPEVPVEANRMIDEMAFALIVVRVLGAVLTAAGVVGLLLSTIGVFGTVAYATERRRHEIGIRVALGADRSGVRRLVLAQGWRLTLIGLAIGLTSAAFAAQLIGAFLYGVAPTDPLTFAGIAVSLVAVSLVASWVPAQRALRLDPAAVLHGD